MGLFSFVASRTSSPQLLTSRVKMLFTLSACHRAVADILSGALGLGLRGLVGLLDLLAPAPAKLPSLPRALISPRQVSTIQLREQRGDGAKTRTTSRGTRPLWAPQATARDPPCLAPL